MRTSLSSGEVSEQNRKLNYGTWRFQINWAPLHVVDAEGCFFIDASGKRYLDFSAQLMCFFFSSRRRHTSCGRDWSSDVCSSDLKHVPERKSCTRSDEQDDIERPGKSQQAPGRALWREGYREHCRRDERYSDGKAQQAEIGRASCRERG